MFLGLITLMFLGSGLAYTGEGPYTNSAHGNSTSGVDRSSIDSKYGTYSNGNCAHCHEAHASLGGAEPAPDTDTSEYGHAGPDKDLLFSEEEGVCETCHDFNGPATDDIKTQIDKDNTEGSPFYAHPTDDYSGRHEVSETTTTNMDPADYADGTSRHAECVDCHNPHAAGSTVHATETNTVSSTSPLYKVCGIGVTNAGEWTVPTYTEIPTSTGISYEYELCFKCHSSWTTQPSGQTNIALHFNTNNSSYHSVEGTGKASGYGNYETPWDANSLMYCSDCHGSEISSDPAGPHGSTIEHILKGNYNRDTGKSGLDTSDHLCFDCHDYQTYKADGNISTGSGFARWQSGGYTNLHTCQKHGSAKGDCVCMDCHCALPHGINRKHLIVLTSDGVDYRNGAKITGFTNVDNRDYNKNHCGTLSGCH